MSPKVRLPRVVHVVDDTTAGGVMRVLDHIRTAPDLAKTAEHSVLCVDRARVSLGRIKADMIVSHLAVSWRAMPMLAALRALHPGTPLVHVEHSYTQAFVAANVTHKGRFATLLRLAYALFDRVVAVSQAQGQWLVQSGAVRARALWVIPSCVDLSAFRALSPSRGAVRTIGAIGRLDRQKGFDRLIAAFRATTCPYAALHIYGEGAEADNLRALAGDDARIHFQGFSKDPVAAMAEVDLVALPSNWEAYGLVAIEALAAGRIVLVSGVDGLTDHIAMGAQVVASPTVSAWTQALQTALSAGAAARPYPVHSKPETAFAQNWQSLIDEMLRPRGRRYRQAAHAYQGQRPARPKPDGCP